MLFVIPGAHTSKFKLLTILDSCGCGFMMMGKVSILPFSKREAAKTTGVCQECKNAPNGSARKLSYRAALAAEPKLN